MVTAETAAAPDFWEWLREQATAHYGTLTQAGVALGSSYYLHNLFRRHSWPRRPQFAVICELFEAPPEWRASWERAAFRRWAAAASAAKPGRGPQNAPARYITDRLRELGMSGPDLSRALGKTGAWFALSAIQPTWHMSEATAQQIARVIGGSAAELIELAGGSLEEMRHGELARLRTQVVHLAHGVDRASGGTTHYASHARTVIGAGDIALITALRDMLLTLDRAGVPITEDVRARLKQKGKKRWENASVREHNSRALRARWAGYTPEQRINRIALSKAALEGTNAGIQAMFIRWLNKHPAASSTDRAQWYKRIAHQKALTPAAVQRICSAQLRRRGLDRRRGPKSKEHRHDIIDAVDAEYPRDGRGERTHAAWLEIVRRIEEAEGAGKMDIAKAQKWWHNHPAGCSRGALPITAVHHELDGGIIRVKTLQTRALLATQARNG